MHSRYGCSHRWRATMLLLFWFLLQIMPASARAAHQEAQLTPQDAPLGATTPTLHIIHVESSHFPELHITVGGNNWPAPLETLPAQVILDDYELPILDDQMVQQEMQWAMAVDTNNLLVRNPSGQTPYVQLTSTLYTLLTADAFVENQDWLAAYLLMGNEAPQPLQGWSQNPNQLFNQILENRPPPLIDTPLSAQPLIDLLENFSARAETDPPVTARRAILLFSTGTALREAAQVIEAAHAQLTPIYVVELLGATAPPEGAGSEPQSALQQLALQTGGQYVALTDLEAGDTLAKHMTDAHRTRVFTVRADMGQPEKLTVSVTLPNGTTLLASADATRFDPTEESLTPSADLPSANTAPEIIAPTATTTNTVANTVANTAVASAVPTANATLAAVSKPAAQGTSTTAPTTANAAENVVENSAKNVAKNNAANVVTLPGLSIQVPRAILQWGLLVLLLPLFYLLYVQVRAPATTPSHPNHADVAAHHTVSAGSEKAPSAIEPRFFLQDDPAHTRFQLKAAPTPSTVQMRGPSNGAHKHTAGGLNFARPPKPHSEEEMKWQEWDQFEAEITVLPADMYDEDVTSRLAEIEPEILGHLVRATSDPHLPQTLPIYGSVQGDEPARQIRLGRHSQNNTIVINDKSISREHAIFIVREGQIYLRDNASSSGTFLNWRRLNPGEELLLHHKDVVSFGQIAYEFRTFSEEEETLIE